MYGTKNMLDKQFCLGNKLIIKNREIVLIAFIALSTILSSLYMSPLPWGHHKDMYPWYAYPDKYQDVLLWKLYLEGDNIPISTTGHLAPHFTSRRYYYNFEEGYDRAKYVIIDTYEIPRGFQKDLKIKEYDAIRRDWKYVMIYAHNGIEVYKQLGITK